MTTERLQELATLNAIGALDGEDLKEFERILEQSDEATRSEIARWNETAARLVLPPGSLAFPSNDVRDTLMRKLQERHAKERSLEGPGGERYDHFRGIYSMFPDRMEWMKHPVPGVQFKMLSESRRRGYVTMLMKVDPGTLFPEHHHSGEEECYVISGSIILNGKRLGPGVLHHGDEDSEHGVLSTDEGALLLLVVAKEDYIPPVS